jgi:hypothetical protein
MQKRTKLDQRFDPSTQNEIFFTMKVYAVKTANGDFESLKYSIDLHPPFESNTNNIEPFASPLRANKNAFHKIFDHVKELLSFLSEPDTYKKSPGYTAAQFRLDEQRDLVDGINRSNGVINYITYQQNSTPIISVGTVLLATGNGDPRPPKI